MRRCEEGARLGVSLSDEKKGQADLLIMARAANGRSTIQSANCVKGIGGKFEEFAKRVYPDVLRDRRKEKAKKDKALKGKAISHGTS